MNELSVCVVGLGYIGLPTASLLATKGFEVLGIDVQETVVKTINDGKIHIVEPDLDALVKSAVDSGQLRAALTPEPSDVFIIAVPTPFRPDKTADISYIEAASHALAPALKSGDLVVLESTSPVGTTERLAEIIKKGRPDLIKDGLLSVYVAHCPERVLPGKILHELVENDRIVGGLNPESTDKALAFYRRFVRGAVIATDCRTAELAKLVENSYRDVNIAFANELSLISHELNIDVWELIALANRHPRVNILNPGPGVGGHCLAVDPWFIVSATPNTARVIRTAREVNEHKPHWVVEQVSKAASRLKSPVIGCLGLAYKPNIDDTRESPALEVTKMLSEKIPEAKVIACEPHLSHQEGVTLVSLENLLEQADIIVGLVAHIQFRTVSRARLQGKMIFDTCGMFR